MLNVCQLKRCRIHTHIHTHTRFNVWFRALVIRWTLTNYARKKRVRFVWCWRLSEKKEGFKSKRSDRDEAIAQHKCGVYNFALFCGSMCKPKKFEFEFECLTYSQYTEKRKKPEFSLEPSDNWIYLSRTALKRKEEWPSNRRFRKKKERRKRVTLDRILFIQMALF